jgi:tetratricopeptide (TPR) repeat protein
MKPLPIDGESFASQALSAHQVGDLANALRLYPRAIAAANPAPEGLFLNYGALLRGDHRVAEAAAVYRRGLALWPTSQQLLRNYGNLQLQEGLALQALALYLRAEAVLPSGVKPGKREAIWRQQASALADLGLARRALQLLEPVLARDPNDVALRLGMAELTLDLGDRAGAAQLAEPVLAGGLPGLEETFQQCNVLLRLDRHDLAQERFEQVTASYRRRAAELDAKTRQKFDTTCWNFALMLLRRGVLTRGWELFEHGRRVPNGRGGMQRTVFKLHPARVIPEWDGSSLAGQRLLINGEQGIGDVLMFTMLVPALLQEASAVGLVTYDRLASLYRRSFPQCQVFDTNDVKRRAIDPAGWDLQVAIGSLPMLRFNQLKAYEGLQPFLKVDPTTKAQLEQRYRPGGSTPLVGFSWKGGGNAKQKRTKSLNLVDFLPLFRLPGLRWISLQYGAVNDELRQFNQEHGLDLLWADDVDPLRDMDRWSALVDSCDLVVSAANTTIHGAGCLGIPTWVILGKDPDWRWLGEPGTPCYWYSSVQIVRQQQLGNWQSPIDELQQALRSWCEAQGHD